MKIKFLLKFLLFFAFLLSLNVSYAEALSKENIILQNIAFDLDNDSTPEYNLILYCNAPGITYTAQETTSIHYKYMTSTTYKYNQLEKNKKIGYIQLTVKSFLDNTGYMCFLDYYSDKRGIKLSFDLTTSHNNSDFETISINDINNKCSVERNEISNKGFLPNKVTYLESEDRYLKFDKIVTTKYLGSSVFEIEPNPVIGSYSKSSNEIKFSYNLVSIPRKEIKASWILSKEPLVDWGHDFAYRTLLNMDYYNDTYFFNDGIYRINMYNYLPRSQKVPSYFKNPAGLQVRACKWVLNHGNLFRIIGLYSMYSYADSYNKEGYIPTQPMSEWLSKDFGIGYNFYDTRFNSDTVESLMRIYTDYPDEYVLEKIKNYIAFYKAYYKKYQYNAGKAIFVPDYMDITGKNKINHTSLNHFISETYAMLGYYKLTGDKEALEIGNQMLDSIKMTSDKWIRPNGDLWYKVTPEGKYVSNDYPLVTYNDLNYFKGFLKQIFGNVPQEIEKLFKSKEKWAIQNRYLE